MAGIRVQGHGLGGCRLPIILGVCVLYLCQVGSWDTLHGLCGVSGAATLPCLVTPSVLWGVLVLCGILGRTPWSSSRVGPRLCCVESPSCLGSLGTTVYCPRVYGDPRVCCMAFHSRVGLWVLLHGVPIVCGPRVVFCGISVVFGTPDVLRGVPVVCGNLGHAT